VSKLHLDSGRVLGYQRDVEVVDAQSTQPFCATSRASPRSIDRIAPLAIHQTLDA
jgi:hypothetical protein